MKIFIGAALAMAWLALTSTAIAGNKATASFSCGTTYSVAAEDGTLLLQYHGKFSLIDVGAGAAIRDGKGQTLSLAEIHPGDWIQYWTESAAGKPVIRKIAVNAGKRLHCSSATVLGMR